MPSDPIKLEDHDLYSPNVEDYLAEREALARAMPEYGQTSAFSRLIYSGWFYLSFFGMLGALAGWAAIEPFFNDAELHKFQFDAEMGRPLDFTKLILPLMLFPTVMAGVGLFLGVAEGLMSRNFTRALVTAAVGISVGFVGGFLAAFIAG